MKGKLAGATLLHVNFSYEGIMCSIVGFQMMQKGHLMLEAVKRMFGLFIFLFYLVRILVI